MWGVYCFGQAAKATGVGAESCGMLRPAIIANNTLRAPSSQGYDRLAVTFGLISFPVIVALEATDPVVDAKIEKRYETFQDVGSKDAYLFPPDP